MFKTYLKETLNYVIDHFAVQSKKHFNSSLAFIIVAGLAAAIISMIYAMLGAFLFRYNFAFNADSLYNAISDIRITGTVEKLYEGIMLLCTGLYGSFIISTMNDLELSARSKYTINDFKKVILPDEWKSFYKLLLLLILVHLVTFKSSTAWFHFDRRVDIFDRQQWIIQSMLHWVDSIINLAKSCLSYLLAILFLITVYKRKLTKPEIIHFKAAILASAFLAFCIDNLGHVLIGFTITYIVRLFQGLMPFSAFMLIPMAIEFCLFAGLAAYFNWSVCTALCLPIKLHAESEESIEDEPVVEQPL